MYWSKFTFEIGAAAWKNKRTKYTLVFLSLLCFDCGVSKRERYTQSWYEFEEFAFFQCLNGWVWSGAMPVLLSDSRSWKSPDYITPFPGGFVCLHFLLGVLVPPLVIEELVMAWQGGCFFGLSQDDTQVVFDVGTYLAHRYVWDEAEPWAQTPGTWTGSCLDQDWSFSA